MRQDPIPVHDTEPSLPLLWIPPRPRRVASRGGAREPTDRPHALGEIPAMSWRDILAALPHAMRDGVGGYIAEAIHRKGELAATSLGPFPAVFVSRPDLIRHVLVARGDVYLKNSPLFELLRPLAGNGVFLSDGEFWRSQRRILKPEFTARGVDALAEGMARVAGTVADDWESACRAGRVVDASDSMREAAMRIICRTVLDVDLGNDVARLCRALDRVLLLFQAQLSVPRPFGDAAWSALKPLLLANIATIDEFVASVITRHRATTTGGLVERLLRAPDPETGRTMTTKHLRDEIITLFIAGHETTATTLAWAWAELCRHPHTLRRLQSEADAVLGDRLPRADDLARLPYARAVFEESMRLYPPLPFVPRLAAEDDWLDGRRIPAGTTVVCSIFALHRRPDVWTSPLEFDPSRFLSERRRQLEPAAYAPFGAGPRLCMGNHFALAEGTVMLSTLARRFDVTLVDQDVGITKLPGSLRPDRPVRLHLRARARASTHTSTRGSEGSGPSAPTNA
ncbi:MAG: cytochrome P450 [Polyangiaceae bacterium]